MPACCHAPVMTVTNSPSGTVSLQETLLWVVLLMVLWHRSLKVTKTQVYTTELGCLCGYLEPELGAHAWAASSLLSHLPGLWFLVLLLNLTLLCGSMLLDWQKLNHVLSSSLCPHNLRQQAVLGLDSSLGTHINSGRGLWNLRICLLLT